MNAVDRLPDGSWVKCSHPGICTNRFHLPDLTLEQARQLPFDAMLPILNTMDPADLISFDGAHYWLETNGIGAHRDYDLPALIWPDGHMEWLQHAKRHRGNDKPAVTRVGGWCEWWAYGQRHRHNGPAVIEPQLGAVEYWVRGQQYSVKEMCKHGWL